MRRQCEEIQRWCETATVDDRGPDVCRIRGCDKPPRKRGLCSVCYDRLRKAGRLDELALPAAQPTVPSAPDLSLPPVQATDTHRRGVPLNDLARLRLRGMGPAAIARETGCCKSTVLRALKDVEESGLPLHTFILPFQTPSLPVIQTPEEEAPVPVAVHMSPVKKKIPRKAPAPPELEPPCSCVEATPSAHEAPDSAPAAAPAAPEEAAPASTTPDDCEGWEEAPESARVEAPPAWPLERAVLRNEILDLRVEVARLNAAHAGALALLEEERHEHNACRAGAKDAEEALADARARIASLEEHLRAAREQSQGQKGPSPAAALLALLPRVGPVLDLLKGWRTLDTVGLPPAALRAARSGIEREIRAAMGATPEEPLDLDLAAGRLP